MATERICRWLFLILNEILHIFRRFVVFYKVCILVKISDIALQMEMMPNSDDGGPMLVKWTKIHCEICVYKANGNI